MDEPTFLTLQAALAASPNNLPLLELVAAELWRRGDAGGVRALVFRPDATPALRLLQVRVLEREGERGQALALYRELVALAPTLEDVELARRLELPEPAQRLPGRPLLRVLSGGEEKGEAEEDALVDRRPPVTFADIGGLSELKEQIRRRVILPREKPGLFERFRKKVGGGVLLYGPPGCGKTLMARATAGETGAAFINVAISDVLDMYLGESEQKLKGIFARARELAPSVLFFDEVEAIGGRRQYKTGASAASVVSQFLSELDGYASRNDGVLIMGATNVPWAVDPAFRRPGRFDRVIFVPPPDRVARAAILELHLRGRPLQAPVSVDEIAKQTVGFSGADLEHLVETAADIAIARSLAQGEEVPIGQAHLLEARKELKPTTVEWLNTAKNYARYANESGQYDDVLQFLEKHSRS